MMQSLGRKYVQYINLTYRRTGTLWEGRYKSTLVDGDSYFLTVSRYIELNPVRAKMVASPSADQGVGLRPDIPLKDQGYPNGIPVFEARSPGVDGRGDYSFKKLVFSE